MNFAQRLEEALKNIGKTQKDLAKYLGVPAGTISTWKKRNSIGKKYLNEVAKFLNVSTDYLLGFEDDKIPLTHYLPVIGEASCGVPTNHFYYEDYDKIPIPADLYREGRYAVVARGDSMLPKINDGDIVICDVNMYVDNGNIVHYTLNGESGIKKVIMDDNNNPIMLMPLNDKYPPIPIKKEDDLRMARCFKVIGNL